MKILFVNPMIAMNGWGSYKKRDRQCNSLHHGILLLATILNKSGHEAKIIDLRTLSGWEDYQEKLHEFSPDIVGATSMSVDFGYALESLKIAKNSLDAVTIIGGIHATIAPQDAACKGYVDMVVTNEAERDIVNIVEGKIKPDNGKILKGRHVESLDELPYIDRSLVPYEEGEMINPYWKGKIPYITLVTGRGCIGKCDFCAPQPMLIAEKCRQRSPANVIGEMGEIIKKWGAGYWDFVDDLFTVNKKWVYDFCDAYKNTGMNIPFVVASRADIISKRPEMFERLRKAGCDAVSVGFELGYNRGLKQIQKGTTVEMNLKAAEILRENGFFIVGNFMFGIPNETPDEARRTVEMINRIKPDVLSWSWYTIHPGTYAFEKYKGFNLLPYDFSRMHRSGTEPKIKGIDYELIKEIMKEIDLPAPDIKELLKNDLSRIDIKKPDRILLFRTNRMPAINMIIEAFKKSYPKCQIDIFAQPDVKDELKRNKGIKEVFINQEKYFTLHDVTRTVVRRLRNMNYDLVVIPYNNNSLEGYQDVEMLASAVCRKEIIGILPSGEIVQRREEDILKDYTQNLKNTKNKEYFRNSA
jgi:anaerobic magnesium-protoporphyrin IX monomethyl ester cyclase